MRRSGLILLTTMAGLTAGARAPLAQETAPSKFQQAYDLIRHHLPGVSDRELEQAAFSGLLQQFAPRVSLVDSNTVAAVAPGRSTSFRADSIEEGLEWVRIGRVDDEALRGTEQALRARDHGERTVGIVLDLRYATGTDYACAARFADLFLDTEQVLLKWGNETARSTSKTNAVKAPLSVLVNRQTSGGGEVLAAILRRSHAGLLLGNRTAGRTAEFKVFPLSGGERLQIATVLPRLGDDQELPVDGLTPDIEVAVDAASEWTWFNDRYATIGGLGGSASTEAAADRPARHRVNEAELVRQQREGGSFEDDPELLLTKRREPDRKRIQDPVLARAVDLLKGLALVRRSGRQS